MAKKLALIASKGTLDWAYPPFILASTAAALDYEVSIFFTFYGLTLLKKDVSDLKVSPLGNPAMPMSLPIPNLVQTLPGMESMATIMMKQKIADKGVASIQELRDICLESGVKLIACQMTMDLFNFKREEFIDGIEIGGAATFFEFAGEADVSLFI
ncbi:MAG TPA: DsrE/DsrF/DrsH-like family protein [Methylophilaceae bacterium]|jgi:peroxiredoxin family protein|nr:DsrE/DsrF/DrsH-like family protein [Methylophilaceae bacterium]